MSNDVELKLKFRIDKLVSRNIKYFVYQEKRYQIDFDSLVLNSNYFYKNRKQYKHMEYIPLLSDEEKDLNISEESIRAFISSCQNEECEITISSVIALRYLSIKYEYLTLTEIADNFISRHSKELIFDTIKFKIKQNENERLKEEEEMILKSINEFICEKEEEMLDLPIGILERIFHKYYLSKEENKKEKVGSKIIEFLFKTLDKYGKDASILFSNIDFGDQNIEVINRLLDEYQDKFDFNMINSTLLKTTRELTSECKKQQEEYRKLFTEMKTEFNKQKQIIEDMIKKEQKREEEFMKKEAEKDNKFKEMISQIIKENEKEKKKIKDEFQILHEQQKKMIHNDFIHKYHQFIIETIKYEQFDDMTDESKNYFIEEIIQKEKEINNTNNEMIHHILCCHRIFDKLSKNGDKSIFEPNKQSKIKFIRKNTKELIVDFDIIKCLYLTNSLKTILEDVIQNYNEFSIVVNYPSEIFDPIMDTLLEIKEQNTNNSDRKNIIVKLFNEKNDKICTLKRTLENIDEEHIKDMINIFFQTYNSGIKEITEHFDKWQNYSEISIPTSVHSIQKKAFYGFKTLTQINIPSSVTSIGPNSFYDCSSLTKISIPSSIKTIEDSCFSRCSSLKNITIPSSITFIGSCAFYNCTSLIEINIPSSLTSIEPSTFGNCSSLKKIRIPSSVNSIKSKSFSNCTSLEQITFESNSSLASIDEQAFLECKSLKQVTIPSSVKKIGRESFKECSSLMKLIFEKDSSITTIDEYAFYNCSSLTQLSIPSSISSIKNKSFYGCKSLTKVSNHSSYQIDNFVFGSCPLISEVNSKIIKT